MKNLLKNLLPAMALTLLVAGTITASAVNNSKPAAIDEEWYGVRDGGQEVLIENPTTFNEDNDCDKLKPLCVQIYNDGEPGETVDGGPYNK